VYPTFAVCPTADPVLECLARTGGDFGTVVHSAQSVRVFGPIPPAGRLITSATLRGIYDMKKMAQVVVETHTHLEEGPPIFDTVWSLYYRGAGGFDGPRPADFSVEQATAPEQALLYRLSGDRNPLHADPQFAASVGFPQGPILHGLCTYGFVARAVVRGACGGDGARLRQLEGQFRRPVWPGDTIITEGWKLEGGMVALRVTVKERPDPVMTAAFADVV
jgi:acyl dehydratase